MASAEIVAKKSKDPNTQVGAVIVSPDRRRIAVGFNGFPVGLDETEERWGDKYRFVLHAELNAIVNSKTDLTGWTLYTTMFPCENCRNIILQSGISRVVYLNDSSVSLAGTIEETIAIFKEMKVDIERFRDV